MGMKFADYRLEKAKLELTKPSIILAQQDTKQFIAEAGDTGLVFKALDNGQLMFSIEVTLQQAKQLAEFLSNGLTEDKVGE